MKGLEDKIKDKLQADTVTGDAENAELGELIVYAAERTIIKAKKDIALSQDVLNSTDRDYFNSLKKIIIKQNSSVSCDLRLIKKIWQTMVENGVLTPLALGDKSIMLPADALEKRVGKVPDDEPLVVQVADGEPLEDEGHVGNTLPVGYHRAEAAALLGVERGMGHWLVSNGIGHHRCRVLGIAGCRDEHQQAEEQSGHRPFAI